MPKSVLFIMDPPENIRVDHDTTFALMLEAQSRGHRVSHTRKEWLWNEDGHTLARWQVATVARAEPPNHLILGPQEEGPLEDHAIVFIRTDPPFDLDYVKMTWLLDAVDKTRTIVVNDPGGLREANEKLYTLRFPELTPPTIVTRDIARLRTFMAAHDDKIVVKPIDLMGGYGVVVVEKGDPNAPALLEMATHNGKELAVAQAYLPEAKQGDKRIIVIDGEPRGAVLRVPPPGEHRGNMNVGAAVKKAPIDDDDRRICEVLAPDLKKHGLHFVGIDVIGGKLTEVNVTSPTGVQEIDRLDGTNLAGELFDALEG